MAFFRLLIATFFLSVTSARYVHYRNVHPVFSTPTLIYSSSFNPASSGYAYATQDLYGGGSNVVFITGANSISRIRDETKLIQDAMMMEKSVEQQSISKEIEASTSEQDSSTNAEVFDKEKKLPEYPNTDDSSVGHQVAPQHVPPVRVAYSPFRANLPNLYFPTASPRYHVLPSAIQNHYYPHNPHYARFELPPHNFGFYNPNVPLFYSTPVAVPAHDFEHIMDIKSTKASVKSGVTENLQTNTKAAGSNTIDSRSNLGSTTDEMKKVSESITDKFEFIKSEVKDNVRMGKSLNSAVKSDNSNEQTTENEVNHTTESVTEETSPMMESSTETSATTTNKI